MYDKGRELRGVKYNREVRKLTKRREHMNRSQQQLSVMKYHGVTKAADIFFETAKLEVGCGGKRADQAQEYINNFEYGNDDSKWRSSGHYYLRKLVKGGRVRYFGGGMYGLCRRCLISTMETKCPSFDLEVCCKKQE